MFPFQFVTNYMVLISCLALGQASDMTSKAPETKVQECSEQFLVDVFGDFVQCIDDSGNVHFKVKPDSQLCTVLLSQSSDAWYKNKYPCRTDPGDSPLCSDRSLLQSLDRYFCNDEKGDPHVIPQETEEEICEAHKRQLQPFFGNLLPKFQKCLDAELTAVIESEMVKPCEVPGISGKKFKYCVKDGNTIRVSGDNEICQPSPDQLQDVDVSTLSDCSEDTDTTGGTNTGDFFHIDECSENKNLNIQNMRQKNALCLAYSESNGREFVQIPRKKLPCLQRKSLLTSAEIVVLRQFPPPSCKMGAFRILSETVKFKGRSIRVSSCSFKPMYKYFKEGSILCRTQGKIDEFLNWHQGKVDRICKPKMVPAEHFSSAKSCSLVPGFKNAFRIIQVLDTDLYEQETPAPLPKLKLKRQAKGQFDVRPSDELSPKKARLEPVDEELFAMVDSWLQEQFTARNEMNFTISPERDIGINRRSVTQGAEILLRKLLQANNERFRVEFTVVVLREDVDGTDFPNSLMKKLKRNAHTFDRGGKYNIDPKSINVEEVLLPNQSDLTLQTKDDSQLGRSLLVKIVFIGVGVLIIAFLACIVTCISVKRNSKSNNRTRPTYVYGQWTAASVLV